MPVSDASDVVFVPSATKIMAERVGFEPTIPVKVCPLSRRIVSTTHAPLRRKLSAVSYQLKRKFLALPGMPGIPVSDKIHI